ncbi:MAG TPA: nucleotide exchange factor GrpE [Acidobacteriaceae bacterium]|nr:nucleotide exchange factor GrpE [Acidobacteriaceae bacterium]
MSRRIFVNRKMNEETLQATPEGESQDESLGTVQESITEAEGQAEAKAVPQVDAAEYERLKAERDSLLDRLARLQAEFENARKREARERAEFRDFAVAGAIEMFLPVLDNFQLALKSTGSAEQLRTGVELIVKQMEEALRTLHVQPVEAVGAVFDPRVHEAIEMVEQPDVPDHQVIDEVRRGYRIKDRLLRPAMVRVASNPQQKEA